MPIARPAIVVLFLLLASPGTGWAEIAPKARAIIERYLEVTGGRAAFEAESTFHARGRIVARDMKGTYEVWRRAPDCAAERLTLGSLRTRGGCHDSVAWKTDLTASKTRMLDGKDLEAERAGVWFETEQWARADQGGGTVTLGSVSYGGRAERQALEVRPPVGPPRTLWFNAKTGLIDRVQYHSDHNDGEEWLACYRAHGGRKRPMEMRPADPALYSGEEGVFLDSVWVNARLTPEIFAAPAGKTDAVTWLKTPGVARVPFRYASKCVWVRASINGAPPADFLLDTGASILALDRDYAASIGLANEGSTVVQGVGARAEASYATVQRLRLTGPDGSGVEVRNLKAAVVDFGGDEEPVLWRKIAGLIGYDFIGRFTTEIDYDREVLTFHDPARFAYQGRGEPIPMGLANGVPTVTLTLGNDCSGIFLVDVGNSGHLLVHGSMVRRCGLARVERKELRLWSGGIGGIFPEWLGRLDSLRIGPYGWSAPLVGLSLHSRGMAGSEDYAGNIGNAVLERFKCTFDYAHGLLYLEPGARYAERDRYSRLGAEFLRIRDRVLAVGILRDSPADEAGLECMDEVRAIDGKPILKFTREDLERIFEDGDEGTTHRITIVRDLDDSVIEVTLRDVI